MKRFLKTLSVLLAALLLLVSGVDTALDHLTCVPGEGSFTFYNEKGQTLFVYRGDLALCKVFVHPFRATQPFQPRPAIAPRA